MWKIFLQEVSFIIPKFTDTEFLCGRGTGSLFFFSNTTEVFGLYFKLSLFEEKEWLTRDKANGDKKYFYVKNNIGQAKKISVCLTCLSQWSLVPGHPFTVRIKVYMTGLQSSWFCTQAPTTQSRLSFSQSVITLYLDVNVLRLYKLAYIFGHMLFIWFVK